MQRVCRVFIFSILLCAFQAKIFAKHIALATTQWPPYVSTELKNMGYVYVIVTTALQNAGYDTSVQFLPWSEAKQLDKHGNNALFPTYENQENDHLICSEPITSSPVGFYKRKNKGIRYSVANPSQHQNIALNSLRHYRIGIVNGYQNINALDNADFLQKQMALSDIKNLQQLSYGEVDLAFSDIFVAEYYINKFYPKLDNIEFMGPSLENKNLYVCFSKRDPNYKEKLMAFNHELNVLKQNGKFEKIYHRYNF